jgi:TM2 domain-containing membrane protein YozV
MGRSNGEASYRISKDTMTMMRYDALKKSVLVGYLFWFFLGAVAAHRFYLGRIWSAALWIMTLISSFFFFTIKEDLIAIPMLVVGIWWAVDAFLIPGMTSRKNSQIITQLTR